MPSTIFMANTYPKHITATIITFALLLDLIAMLRKRERFTSMLIFYSYFVIRFYTHTILMEKKMELRM